MDFLFELLLIAVWYFIFGAILSLIFGPFIAAILLVLYMILD